ncbi:MULTISPECIES: TrmH family RNA methyltransferase [unclassified Streptomyces]|uniref:TrmH family RNA methyltransferase n=1 Tax=unclassified Streptomyces TaxID=2593676 RepID=UPI002DDBE2CA|nr:MULTISPECIES: TrmH family RNA methyltransferase [unclassified Streptomyces]WSA93583.1 TrmH family RNA methyltransferase [Streptomyces sp. NBC_01795]WSB77953.1 TrmH family RNA methyltransferase [Streptomyces sp. NBC_01775]WSS13791.1 TrmH family RNA methyltransferase [Streptomyces sp. NBC_01186]WSS42615.1 TrmH family RNA methyltransferase [Streptomyces sp. NBC_01187]
MTGGTEWERYAAEGVLLDGFHALKHALRFGARVPVAVARDRPAALALAAELAPDLTGTLEELLEEVPGETLRALVPRPHPTGVAALALRDPARGGVPRERSGRDAPLVVLDNPRNLGNVGAVVRLVAGAGAGGVLTTGDADPWHPSAVRASAGLHFATAVERREAAALPEGPLYAFDPDGADLRDAPLPRGAMLAFGSERHGLSDVVRARADHLVALPMEPQVSSYNLATSVAMALYHWMAQSA